MSVVFASDVERSRWYDAYTTYERMFEEAFAAIPKDWEGVAQSKQIATLRLIISWFEDDAGFEEDKGAVPSFNYAEREMDPITVKDYILKRSWTRNQIRDDATGTIDRSMDAAMSAVNLWVAKMNALVFGVLNNAETTACWNGQNLVDTAHPVNPDRSDFSTQSNLISGAALSGTTLNSAMVRMLDWKMPNNLPRPMIGQVPTLWVPTALTRTAEQLRDAEYYTPTATQGVFNTTGASPNDLRGKFAVRTSQYLTSTTAAFLVVPTMSGRRPVIVADRQQPEMTQLGPGTEHYTKEKTALIMHEARAEAVAGYPETVIKIRP